MRRLRKARRNRNDEVKMVFPFPSEKEPPPGGRLIRLTESKGKERLDGPREETGQCKVINFPTTETEEWGLLLVD